MSNIKIPNNFNNRLKQKYSTRLISKELFQILFPNEEVQVFEQKQNSYRRISFKPKWWSKWWKTRFTPNVLYNSIKNNKIKVINSNIIGKGSYSHVYTINYNGNDTKYIFKLTNYIIKEYRSLIFHILLQRYLRINKKNNSLNMICNIYEIGTCKIDSENKYYSIMDNCGEELQSYLIKTETSYNLSGIVELMIELCECIKIIHDIGYVYLDFKPQNFLIDSNGNIKLIDFGLVTKKYTQIGLNGTLRYISPRLIIKPNETVECDVDLDLFSIGCFFTEMIYYFLLDVKNIYISAIVCPYSSNLNKKSNLKAIRLEYLNENIKYNDINFLSERLNGKYNEDTIKSIIDIINNCVTVNEENTNIYKIDDIIYDLNNLLNNTSTKNMGTKSSNNLDKKISPINYNRLGSINGSNTIFSSNNTNYNTSSSTTVFGTNSGTNNNK